MKTLTGSGSFVRYLLSEALEDLSISQSVILALKDYQLGYADEGCFFAIADPGGDNETFIVIASGTSVKDGGHSDETLAAVAWLIQRRLEYCDRAWFRDVSGVDSPLVRWFKTSELGHISEKTDDERWEPHKFHTDTENDMRPFTKFELDNSPHFPHFGTWNQIYIRIYFDGELDESFGSNKPQYIDLLENVHSYQRVNFSKVVPSEYLDRLALQFDDSPLSDSLEKWWELPGVFKRPSNS